VVYPHTNIKGFSKKHGGFYNKGADCTSCHGEDLAGRGSAKSCNSCHKSYPHTKEFKDSFKHGVDYLKTQKVGSEIPKDECLGCHKENVVTKGKEQKRDKMKSCQDCHAFPHNKNNWVKSGHGPAFEKKGEESCSTCHAKDSTFKERNPEDFSSCLDCHNNDKRTGINPHDAGEMSWKRESHGYKADEAGVKKCTICHVKKVKGEKSKIKTCNMCHKNYPHNTIKDIDEDEFYEGMHGEKYNNKPKNCQDCHANEKSKIKVENSCMDCHDSMDMAPANHFEDKFTSRKNHGTKYLKNSKDCTICHKPVSEGGTNSCKKCHNSFPHENIEDFYDGVHGDSYYDNPKECGTCHENEDSGVEVETRCIECHDSMDMAPKTHERSKKFVLRKNHGYQYLEDKANCELCHTADAETNTCSKCHGPGVSMPHSDIFKDEDGEVGHGSHGETWKLYCRNGANNVRPTCANCHGNSKSHVELSCLDCHDSDPMSDPSLCGPYTVPPGKPWPWK
jgi:hypothetical protein